LPLRYSLTVISVIFSAKIDVPKGHLLSVTHS
jgi:putative transposon-encoded protein